VKILKDKILKLKKEYRESLLHFYKNDLSYIHQKNYNSNLPELEKLEIYYELFQIESKFKKEVLGLLESQDVTTREILIDKTFGIAHKDRLLIDKSEYLQGILKLEENLSKKEFENLKEYLEEEKKFEKSYHDLLYKMKKGI
jgi:hypothetical protein